MSREFSDLVKAVGDSKSKQEEDKIILKVPLAIASHSSAFQLAAHNYFRMHFAFEQRQHNSPPSMNFCANAAVFSQEVATLRTRLSEKDAAARMKELCIRMMYCEMLGHPVEFGYIHAVNMTQRMTLVEKKTGYLAASLFLGENSELLILLVNTLQRDLRSQNPWEVCAALSAVTRLIGAETIPAVLALVKECFTHQSEHVRKKAVMALHRFLQKSPDTVTDYMEHFKRAICDR